MQEPNATVEVPRAFTSLFSIELEPSVFKRLRTLATKEDVSINELGSELIKRILLLHRTELRRVIDQLKRKKP